MPSSIDEILLHDVDVHLMLLYETTQEFSKAYCKITNAALKNNEIVLILTFFEAENAVLSNLRKAGVDVNYYIKTDSLFIIDSITQFFNSSCYDTIRFIQLLHKNAIRNGSKGITAIVDMNAYFLKENLDELRRFEELADPKSNQLKFKSMLCAYEREMFNKLDEKTQQAIRARHHAVLANDADGNFITL
jgi:hypothetical protein